MTILNSITSLSGSNKSYKNKFVNGSIKSNVQSINSNAGFIGDINRGLAGFIGTVTGATVGLIAGGIDYGVQGALTGFTSGLAFGIL